MIFFCRISFAFFEREKLWGHLQILTSVQDMERKSLVPLIELELMEAAPFPTIILENSTWAKTNALRALQRSFQRIRLWAPTILNSLNFIKCKFPWKTVLTRVRNEYHKSKIQKLELLLKNLKMPHHRDFVVHVFWLYLLCACVVASCYMCMFCGCIIVIFLCMCCGSVRSLSLKWKQSCLYSLQLGATFLNICYHWTTY